MEAAGGCNARRARVGDARARVTRNAEVLGRVTTDALGLIETRGDLVLVEPVVGVNASWPGLAVVAVVALLFFVAIGAKRGVIAGDLFVSLNPVSAVMRVLEPTWRKQGPRREHRADHVAGRAADDGAGESAPNRSRQCG